MALQMGSRGPDVSAVQAKLNALLTPSPRLVTDGSFGMKTSQAVKLFQQRKGLVADGVVGPKTAAALGLPNQGGGGGGGGGFVQPPRTVPGPPGMQPPAGSPPSGFVDMSALINAAISGQQAIASSLLSWIDSDDVPQIVYDRVAGMINGASSRCASRLNGLKKQAVPFGQNPAVYVTSGIRDALAEFISGMCNVLQPLAALPVIGFVGVGYQRILGGYMSKIDTILGNASANGQAAQAAATQLAATLQGIARQIG